MKNILLKNFGPVDESEINISPLTIFVGNNSSGKSFISLLIHSLTIPFNHNSHVFPQHSLNYLLEHNKNAFDEFEEGLDNYFSLKPSWGG